MRASRLATATSASFSTWRSSSPPDSLSTQPRACQADREFAAGRVIAKRVADEGPPGVDYSLRIVHFLHSLWGLLDIIDVFVRLSRPCWENSHAD